MAVIVFVFHIALAPIAGAAPSNTACGTRVVAFRPGANGRVASTLESRLMAAAGDLIGVARACRIPFDPESSEEAETSTVVTRRYAGLSVSARWQREWVSVDVAVDRDVFSVTIEPSTWGVSSPPGSRQMMVRRSERVGIRDAAGRAVVRQAVYGFNATDREEDLRGVAAVEYVEQLVGQFRREGPRLRTRQGRERIRSAIRSLPDAPLISASTEFPVLPGVPCERTDVLEQVRLDATPVVPPGAALRFPLRRCEVVGRRGEAPDHNFAVEVSRRWSLQVTDDNVLGSSTMNFDIDVLTAVRPGRDDWRLMLDLGRSIVLAGRQFASRSVAVDVRSPSAVRCEDRDRSTSEVTVPAELQQRVTDLTAQTWAYWQVYLNTGRDLAVLDASWNELGNLLLVDVCKLPLLA